tara:strand:- start:1310 stop:1702 length:393 start_codon:yes stop_codon:yes gene_type:complete
MHETLQSYKCCVYKNASIYPCYNQSTTEIEHVTIPDHLTFYKKFLLTAYLFPSTRANIQNDDDVIQLVVDYGNNTCEFISHQESIEEDNMTEFVCFDKFTEKSADDYMEETGLSYQLYDWGTIKYGNWLE